MFHEISYDTKKVLVKYLGINVSEILYNILKVRMSK